MIFHFSDFPPIEIQANSKGITLLTFDTTSPKLPKNEQERLFIQQAQLELAEYFCQKRKSFSVPLSLQTGTIFQQKVWLALLTIPYGETRSYQEIATLIDSPKAVRAIGQANKKNPLAIFIPCHRVIGKNGQLTGYMGTQTHSLSVKHKLLQLEKTTDF